MTDVSSNTKKNESKKGLGFLLNKKSMIAVAVSAGAIAAFVLLKPATDATDATEIDVNYYSDVETSIPVFNNPKEAEPESNSAENVAKTDSPTSEAKSDTVTGDVAKTLSEAVEEHSGDTEKQNPSDSEQSINDMLEHVSEAATSVVEHTQALSTNFTGQPPAPAAQELSDGYYSNQAPTQQQDFKNVFDAALEERNKRTENDQNLDYVGRQLTIPYAPNSQTKVYLYRNFAVKIFLPAQSEAVKELNYFINGSDHDDHFDIKLLPNNILLLSKKPSSEVWGGTDLFITHGKQNYTFILLSAKSPDERTDSIHYEKVSANTTSK
ncbi:MULTISPECIES: hypothetical protein [Morganellaceae]|uniref:Uncharacterized protein n=1 Tax=Providencia rettgeri TaxID=587 RepID=A0AB35LHA7_PRORE|nr:MULTISPECIES: hypothetical protein [Morganellaceae]ELB1544914.1 hypothetical protein [Morganella morganii]EKV4067933.1 hypothetical protein [Proteus mirabilis]MCI9768556.1 hypothetical protein [Proteus mirabilis]MCI9772146.1 hypothetical protein [Proteus mirabilis]MCI9775738.1 hypothetical protein [Proteus mirabilis]